MNVEIIRADMKRNKSLDETGVRDFLGFRLNSARLRRAAAAPPAARR